MAASPKDRPVGNPLRAASDDYSTLENEGDMGSARRRRRSLNNCPQCDYLGYKPHRVCPECGYYNGKKVISVEGSA